MQSRGCVGLEYKPLDQQGLTSTTPIPPTLGFWLYVAIIGGTLLGTAMVLIIVHSLLHTRPIHPDSFRVSKALKPECDAIIHKTNVVIDKAVYYHAGRKKQSPASNSLLN